MPIYEYVCAKCGEKTEVIQRIGERRLRVCPRCGGKLTKAVSAPAIQFKGTGWYVTDYARARKEEKGGARGESKAESSEKSDKAEKGEKAEKKEKKTSKE